MKPQAIQKLQTAADLEPSAQVYAALGRIHVELGQLPAAEAVLARAEQVDPRWEMTYVYRGLMYRSRNEFEAAAAEFRRALALNPGNASARELLTEMQRRMSLRSSMPSQNEEDK
jgi:tetratricopeptide (TPR) repeat protein